MSLTKLGDIAAKAYGIETPLNRTGGKAGTVFDLTLQNLNFRAARLGMPPAGIELVRERAAFEFNKGVLLCESPLECMALAALINADWPHFTTIPPLVHDAKAEAELPEGDLIIVPQFAFVRHRLDLAVIVRGRLGQRIVAIECDGKEYHDPVADAARDRYLKSWGLRTYRITGKELYRDAARAVEPAVFDISSWKQDTTQ